MNELPLRLFNQSISLLADHTALTEQKKKTKEEIKEIFTVVDSSKFAEIPSSGQHVKQLNEMISRMENNKVEEGSLIKRSSDAHQQIAALQRKSKTFSIILIIAVVILVIVIMTR